MRSDKPPEDLRTQFIYPLLQKTLYASLSTFCNDHINSRYMIFACDERLQRFYFLSTKDADKVRELQGNAQATLSVLSPSAKLDDYAETTVIGHISLSDRFADPEVQAGLRYLTGKSSLVQSLAESGDLKNYYMLRMSVQEIVFRVYKDIINSVPKAIFKF